MFCLSCGKKIVESSKFCRYCGEKIDDNPNKEVVKNNKRFYLTSFRNFWAILWVITMLVFVLTLVIFAKFDESNINLFNNILLLKFFLFNICLGIISFIFIFFTKIVPKKPLPKFIKYGFIFLFSYLIINPAIFAIEGYKAKTNEEYKNKYYKSNIPILISPPIIKITPTPTSKIQTKTNKVINTGSQIDCIGPDGKQFKTTMDECKKLNEKWGKTLDYMTNCNIHSDCGGGTIYMKYSDCMKPCSGLPQKTNNTNTSPTNSNKIAVFLTYGGYTIYCPSQNAEAVKSIDATMTSKKEQWAKESYECDINYIKNSSCYAACRDKGVSDPNYSECIKPCSYFTDCDYIYNERKNLSSQINNLCK